MSGIVGIFYRDGRPVESQTVQRMVDILAHRGPDGADVWCKGPVGLGHRMLHTTPESLNEKLPFVNQTSGLAITADARIDNRDELLHLLRLDDRPAGDIPDSQIILAAYEKWGEHCPEFLLGDFAFAVWDKRKQTFFCARDHFGVKPFYYYLSDHLFVFASEIKALFCLAEVPRRLNEERIADYLIPIFDDQTITFYQNIFRLTSACSLLVKHQTTDLHAYWTLDPSHELTLGSDKAYAEAFKEYFTEAVRCRLRSHSPVGALLSGGLDSSSIACVGTHLMAETGHKQIHTFSSIFDEVTECDERHYINAVLAQGKFTAHYIHGDQMNVFEHFDCIHWHLDEPFFAPNLVMSWGLYSEVKRNNVRVLLNGFDGDSTVSHGYGFLKELARAGHWLELANNVRGVAKIHDIPAWEIYWSYVWVNQLQPFIGSSHLLRRVWRRGRGWWRWAKNKGTKAKKQLAWNAIVNPDFGARFDLKERHQAWKKTGSNSARTERERHYRMLTQGLRPFALEVLDKATAAFAIEPRYPFWDKRLVEFCLALPAKQKLKNGWSRMILRRAMTDILPSKVQWRTDKADFSPNVSHGLLTYGQEYLDNLIYHDSELIQEYVNVDNLQDAYRQFVSQSDPVNMRLVWQAVSLAQWLQMANSFWLNSFTEGGDAFETNTPIALC